MNSDKNSQVGAEHLFIQPAPAPQPEEYSRRLRVRSGRKKRDPNFIYEEDISASDIEHDNRSSAREEASESARLRSASWSGTNRAAIVERVLKAPNKNKGTNAKDKSVNIKVKGKGSAGDKFKDKQAQLSQQRLDLWLPVKSPQSKELHNKAGKQLISSSEVLSGEQLEKTNIGNANPNATSKRYLNQYGSDFDSLDANTEEVDYLNPSIEEQVVIPDTMAGTNGKAGEKGKLYESEWKQLLEEAKVELQTNFTNSIAEAKRDLETSISELREEKVKVETDLKEAKRQLKVCQLQLNETAGVCVKHDQVINECKRDIEMLKEKADRSIVKIAGLIEKKNEDCAEIVKTFFRDVLKVTGTVPLVDTHRVGKGDDRLMIVYLANPRDKGRIFACGKNLKDVKNRNDKPYNIFDQLTAKKRAEKNRKRQLHAANKAMEAKDQLEMKFNRGDLIVDGEKYVKKVRPPSCREILQASKAVRLARIEAKAIRGETVTVEDQEFVGYSAAVKSLKEVNLAYGKVRAMHMDARHVICACRIASRSFHTHQDYNDDDEHNAGQFLLQLLESSEIMNRVVFVVRYYDGTHIGQRRYRAIRDAAASAVDKSARNEITGLYDTIWQDEADLTSDSYRFTFGKVSVRGRGGLGSRGGRGGRGGRYTPNSKDFDNLERTEDRTLAQPGTQWSTVVANGAESSDTPV